MLDPRLRMLLGTSAVGLVLAGCGSGGPSLSARGSNSSPVGSTSSASIGTSGGSTTTKPPESASTTEVSGGTAASGTGTAPPGTIVSTGTTGTTLPPSSSSTVRATTTTTTAPLNPPTGSGAYGYVTAGPTCPVEQAGQPCPPRPVSAEVDARDAAGSTVRSTNSDSSGRYSLSLPVGDYTLVVVTPSGFPRCPDTPVTVRAGAPTRADISCDTGIR